MNSPDQSTEVLIVTLGGQYYGIDIHQIQELCCSERVMPVVTPRAYVTGAIDLHHIMVPIIDPYVRHETESQSVDAIYVILKDGANLAGLAVDGILDVQMVHSELLQSASRCSPAFRPEFLTGSGQINGQSVLMLDGTKMVGEVDLSLTQPVAA